MRKYLWVLWVVLSAACIYYAISFAEDVRHLLTVPFAMVVVRPSMVETLAFTYSYAIAVLAFLAGLFTGLIFVKRQPKFPPLPEIK